MRIGLRWTWHHVVEATACTVGDWTVLGHKEAAF